MTAEKNQVAVPFGGNGVPMTMSSREIAELVEARHNDVVATIERLFNKGLLRSSRKSRRESTGSRPGDVVFDPFMGSGTTAAVALQHGRQYLGCELNPDYKPLQDERISPHTAGPLFMQDFDLEGVAA